jgi:hypothetical protein
MPEDHDNKIREQGFPISGDPFSSKTEQLQELVNFLASNYQEINRFHTESGKRTVIGGSELKVYEVGWKGRMSTSERLRIRS